MTESKGDNHHFWIGRLADRMPDHKSSLVITDPPYNRNFKYGEGVNDNLPRADYHNLLVDTVDKLYDEYTEDDAHLFIIHYPEELAAIWHRLVEPGNGRWKFHQWISWVYPSNTGRGKHRWTRAHRTILWLTKGNPSFNPEAVLQPFKNPTDRRVRQHLANGKTGVPLYDWWEIPVVMNSSKEHLGYKNQIPSELLRRIILCASEEGQWVADPFTGPSQPLGLRLNAVGRLGAAISTRTRNSSFLMVSLVDYFVENKTPR